MFDEKKIGQSMENATNKGFLVSQLKRTLIFSFAS